MICDEADYQITVKRIDEVQSRLDSKRTKLAEMDLSEDEVNRVLDPIRSFHEQLKEEVKCYERLKRNLEASQRDSSS